MNGFRILLLAFAVLAFTAAGNVPASFAQGKSEDAVGKTEKGEKGRSEAAKEHAEDKDKDSKEAEKRMNKAEKDKEEAEKKGKGKHKGKDK